MLNVGLSTQTEGLHWITLFDCRSDVRPSKVVNERSFPGWHSLLLCYNTKMADRDDEIDKRIIKLLQHDRQEGVTLLYSEHYRAVYNKIKLLLRDPDEAKDLVQDLFLKIWEGRKELKLTPPLRRYLLTAGYRRVINHIRSKGRAQKNLGEVAQNISTQTLSSQDALEARELSTLVKIAINLLPDKTRIVFLLSRNMKMSYREIAGYLDVSEKAVEKHMTIALKLLRKFLGPYLNVLILLANL